MLRHGYPACQTCHVSTSGGGALSAYGRAISAEIQSFIQDEGEGDFMHTPWMPEWLAIGGDIRHLNLAVKNYGEETTYRTIEMQKDLELAFRLWGYLWIGASYGEYYSALEPIQESRKHYLIFQPNEHVSLRAGKFLPAYGINHPDHTSVNRGVIGLGQGNESYNAEAHLSAEDGELTFSAILGKDVQFGVGDSAKIYSDSEQGLAVRFALFPMKNLTVGLSYKATHVDNETQSYLSGVFLMYAPKHWAYLMADYNYLEQVDDFGILERSTVWAKLGFEPYRGFHTFYELDLIDENVKHSLGLAIYPRAHFEFLGKASLVGKDVTYLLLSHYYF